MAQEIPFDDDSQEEEHREPRDSNQSRLATTFTMNEKMKNILISSLPALAALGAIGSYFGVAYFTKDLEWDTQSSFLMPFPLLFTMMAINWAWARDMKKIRPTVERWPSLRLSNWWIFGSAAAASYLASFLPDSLLEATVLTTILSVALWLAVVQLTRALLRERTRDLIAQECGLKSDDSVVRNLANNNDLANAIVVSVFTAAETWILSGGDLLPDMSTGGARTLAFLAGWVLGLAYFAWCPHQSDIREFISRAKRENDD